MENLEPLQQLCLQWGKSLYIKSATNRVHNPYSGVLLPAGPKWLQELLAGASIFHPLVCCCLLEQRHPQGISHYIRLAFLSSGCLLHQACWCCQLLPVRVVSWVSAFWVSSMPHCSVFCSISAFLKVHAVSWEIDYIWTRHARILEAHHNSNRIVNRTIGSMANCNWLITGEPWATP